MTSARALAAAVSLACVAAAAPDARAESPFSLGARAGVQSLSLEGDSSPSDLRGYVFGLDAALRAYGALSIGAALEPSIYDERGDRLPRGGAATSWAAFAFARLDTNREGPWSATIELATGYRWLIVPIEDAPAARFGGLEPLRLRVGPTYRASEPHVDVGLLVGVGFGWFADRATQACAVVATCPDSLLDSDTQSAAHFTADLSLLARFH